MNICIRKTVNGFQYSRNSFHIFKKRVKRFGKTGKEELKNVILKI